jgi:hypothetical protein
VYSGCKLSQFEDDLEGRLDRDYSIAKSVLREKGGMASCGIFPFSLAWLLLFWKLSGPYTPKFPLHMHSK